MRERARAGATWGAAAAWLAACKCIHLDSQPYTMRAHAQLAVEIERKNCISAGQAIAARFYRITLPIRFKRSTYTKPLTGTAALVTALR